MEENKQVVAEWKATNQERLSEIKSFNPELYSAINLALNYLNKSLTGEELIQEIEEVEVQPVEPGFKLSIETIPSTLKRDYQFSANIGDRKSPSQSAGKLYNRFVISADSKSELFNTFFKGNDGAWWNLQEVKGTWRWEKSSPQPTMSSSSTSTTPEPIVEQDPEREWYWRFKTKAELEEEYGTNFRGPAGTGMNSEGKMDWLFGQKLSDVTLYEDADITELFNKGISIDTIASLDKNKKKWSIMLSMATTKPLPIQQQEEQWYFKTLAELDAQSLGYAGLDKRTILKYAGKNLTELNLRHPVEEIIKGIKNHQNVSIDGYIFPSKFFTATPSLTLKTQTSEPVKKEWEAKDLVGKTLLFKSSGKKYLVEKFTRNNPKNKEYKLRDLSSPSTPEITYKISMSLVKKWLDGKTASNISIFEEEPTTSDYSKWSQEQLKTKRRDISEAILFFEEDDQEYKDLKDQLDIIDTFID